MTTTVALRVYKSKATHQWCVSFEATYLNSFDNWREAFNYAHHIATFSGSVR